MAGRIQRNFIDDLLARTDIVDIVDARVPLKKKGANYSACCPFHDEKTPSFTVSMDKQFYHCFGCGAHGSAIGFLMDYDHLDFIEAIEELALRAGVDVLREDDGIAPQPKRDLKPLLDLNEEVSLFYQSQLRQHTEAAQLVAYLKKRGVTGEVAKKFQLGFAPPGWGSVLTALGSSDDSRRLLNELGLIVTNENNKTYDRFRERLVFPIRNKRGQVVGFGGRVLDDSMPKYLNSPETPLFHKGREVYGLYEVLQSSGKNQRIILVEGYMDVIALHQYGVTNVVAALGTAITQDHIELLFRSTSELVICLDGDSAGQKAAWRSVVNALPVLRGARQLKILTVPEGEDPDSLIRSEGLEAFQQRILAATPLSEYFFETLKVEHPLDYIEGRSAFLEKARPLLDTMPAGAFSSMMKKQLGRLTDTKIAASSSTPLVSRVASGDGKKRPSTIRHVITLLLRNPEFAFRVELSSTFLTSDIPGIAVLNAVLAEITGSSDLSSAMLLERFRGAQYESTINALFSEEVLVANENTVREFDQAVGRLQVQANKNRYNELLNKSGTTQLTPAEKQELRELI